MLYKIHVENVASDLDCRLKYSSKMPERRLSRVLTEMFHSEIKLLPVDNKQKWLLGQN